MAELKTRRNDGDVNAFLDGVEDDRRREDSYAVLALMKEVTGEEPRMWGGSIVGFGEYISTYASGRTVDWMATGFSPRKQALTLYITPGFTRFDELMGKLGKHTTGKSCLYIKKLEDVDLDVLRELIGQSVKWVAEQY